MTCVDPTVPAPTSRGLVLHLYACPKIPGDLPASCNEPRWSTATWSGFTPDFMLFGPVSPVQPARRGYDHAWVDDLVRRAEAASAGAPASTHPSVGDRTRCDE